MPEIRVFADLLGITRYFACSMPSSATQPISMFREPVHFPLMTNLINGRCVVANEISSSEYEGSKGQHPVKWHYSSECNTVTEAEVAAIVHLKQAFEDASHPIHPNTTLHFILMTSTTPSIILLVPIHSHTSIHLQHYTSQHFFIHNKTPHMYILVHKYKTIQTQKSTGQPHS